MKKYFFVVASFLSLCTITTAQIVTSGPITPAPFPTPPIYLNCRSAVSNACNYIQNRDFQINAGTDPSAGNNTFSYGMINNWSNSHGSPNTELSQTIVGLTTPVVGSHAAFFYCGDENGAKLEEGMYGRIFPLVQGRNYVLNFYNILYSSSSNVNNEFDIYLVKSCGDQATYFPTPNSYMRPSIPSLSQKIYADQNFVSTTSWKQNSICFTANSNYDMIWISPKYLANYTNMYLFVGFAFPTLIDAQDLAINVTIDPNAPEEDVTDCYKMLIPFCGSIPNATYTWYLNGNLFSTQQNPSVNSYTQYGNFVLTVTLPTSANNNIVNTNCSSITSPSLYIPRCAECITLPRIQ
jgi:hypothetical protein